MKICKICKNNFTRPKCYSNKQWSERKYCSAICARKDFSEVRKKQWKSQDYWELMSKGHVTNGNGWYDSVHRWVRNFNGTATKCSKCGKKKTTPKSIQWANIDHKYHKDMRDWIQLCSSCHKLHDLRLKNNEKSNSRRR